MFEEHPLLGIGFIDAKSDAGKELGLDVSGEFSAYTTDSGYLTLLVSFGILGSLSTTYLFLLRFSLEMFH